MITDEMCKGKDMLDMKVTEAEWIALERELYQM